MNYYDSEKLANNFIIKIFLQILMWILSLGFDSLMLCYITSLFGFFTSFFYLLNFFNGKLNPIKFLQISSVFLIFVFNVGWLFAGYFSFIYEGTDLFSVIEHRYSIHRAFYLYAHIYVLVFSLMIFLLSLNTKIINIENFVYERLLNINYININIIIGITLIIITLEFLLIISGFIMNRTFANENYQAGIIPFYIHYLNAIFYFHTALTGFLLYKYKEDKDNFKLIIIVISFITLMLIFFSFGRTLFTFYFVQLLFWYCFFNKGFPNYKKILPVLIFLIPILFYLNVFNNFMRSSLGKELIEQHGSKDLISTIFELKEAFTELNLLEAEEASTGINLSNRGLLVSPLAISIALPMSQKEFFLGQFISSNIIWAIPRIIFPGKVNFLKGEDLMVTKFNHKYTDTSNALFFYSYLDFGYFGLLIYPLLFFLFWRVTAAFVMKREFNSLIALIFVSWGLHYFLTIFEWEMTAFLGYLRDIIILGIIFLLFLKGKHFIAPQENKINKK